MGVPPDRLLRYTSGCASLCAGGVGGRCHGVVAGLEVAGFERRLLTASGT